MKKTFLWRSLEILPGAATWFSFIAPIVLSFFIPVVVATYILLLDIYWMYRSLVIGVNLIIGYRNLKHDLHVDWVRRMESVKPTEVIKDWREIYQVVILATYKESFETLDTSIQALADSHYNLKKVILVLATEERDKANARQIAKRLVDKYGSKFYKFLVTEHPDGIIGEHKAKGANVTWAAKKLRLFLDEKSIAYDNAVVTTADADTRIHRQYLACLSYNYCIEPNRDRRSFQPITLYSNNIWQAPAICRIIAFGNSFWQMIEASRPWRLVNFATHAMSMKMLIQINYWEVGVVNEDSRQFWRAYFTFDGDHKAVPLFIPVYMDAVLAHDFWGTIKNQYLQKQRWAYGVEHVPYVVIESYKNRKIAFWDKTVKIYRLLEGNYSWATASIFIAIMAWFPLLFGPGFSHTVLGANLLVLIRTLMSFTWAGIVVSVWISLLLLPPRPAQYGKSKMAEMVLQWFLVPVQAVLFSSFPAIDAQTRLMLGKYLTFRVTEKKAV
ncbi:MAG: glycosyltransferase family 2 protein [Candidatus Berkelbacteria bacterium]